MSVPNSLRRFFYSSLLVTVLSLATACGGLSAEPKTVSTLVPSGGQASTAVPPTVQAVSVPVTSAGNAASGVVQTEEVTKPAPTATSGVVKTEDAAGVIGSVSGRITNGTAGGVVPPGLKVTLHSVDQNGGDTTLDATADANGDFLFKDVPISAALTYGVTTMYQNRQFVSDGVTGDPAVKVMSLPIKLYEIASDPAVISISSIIIRANATTDGLQVAQVVHFKNTSDRAYSSAQPTSGDAYGSVSIALPTGASLMGFADSSSRFILSSSGTSFTDTVPVLPDEDHVIHYVYTMPYREDGTLVELPVGYPVDGSVQLILNPPSLAASSQQLLPLGVQTMGTSSFQAYGGQIAMKAGDILRFQVSGKLDGSASSTSGSPISGHELIIGILIGIGSAAIVLGIVLLVRDRATGKQPERPAPKVRTAKKGIEGPRQAEIEKLISQLAQLDEQHEQGKIKNTTYNRQRSTLKARIAELMKA